MSTTVKRQTGTEVKKVGGTTTGPKGKKINVKVYKDVTSKAGTTTFFNQIQLEATGIDVNNCRWLQFVHRIRKDKKGKEIPGTYIAGVFHHYGVKGRHVDSHDATSPFYDARGLSNRSKTETSIFDRPDVDEEAGVQEVRVIFDAFLVCHGKVVYQVHWERVGIYDKAGNWQRKYENISGKAIDGLPPYARTDKLAGGFGRRNKDGTLSRPFVYDNPVAKDCRTPGEEKKKMELEKLKQEKLKQEELKKSAVKEKLRKKIETPVKPLPPTEPKGNLKTSLRLAIPKRRPSREEMLSIPVFYVAEGSPRALTETPLNITLQAGGGLMDMDGGEINRHWLYHDINTLAKSLPPHDRLVVNLHLGDAENEARICAAELAATITNISTAIAAAANKKQSANSAVQIFSRLLGG